MGALPICFEVEAARDFEPSAREAADRVRIAMIAVPAEAMLVTQGRREFGAARHDRGIDARRDGRVSEHVAAISDRTSVEWGKGVYVRVEPGGRRCIKKKTKQNTNH